jgi:hypothetical protein
MGVVVRSLVRSLDYAEIKSTLPRKTPNLLPQIRSHFNKTVNLLLLLLITALTFQAFGQKKIEGEIRLKGDNSALPGVNVVETGTDNSVSSNGDGQFSITCESSSPTLAFSFVGLKTIHVSADKDFLTVYLETDEEQLKENTRLGIYPEYTSIGLNSGVNYTPIGINVTNSLPGLFGLRMLTTTTFNYRTDLANNELIDIRLKRDRLINTHYLGRHFNLELGYNRKQITRNADTWNTEDLNIIPEFVFESILFRLGYGRQSLNDIETLHTNQGLIFGFGKYFAWSASITGTAKKWNNYWQTEVQFTKWFRKNEFQFGARFETMDNYREFDLLLLYRIHY